MINILHIEGEAAFQVLAHSFTVSPSASGYVLQYSANGTDWSSYSDEVPANENLIVNGCAYGQYIKLSGNTDTVQVVF